MSIYPGGHKKNKSFLLSHVKKVKACHQVDSLDLAYQVHREDKSSSICEEGELNIKYMSMSYEARMTAFISCQHIELTHIHCLQSEILRVLRLI